MTSYITSGDEFGASPSRVRKRHENEYQDAREDVNPVHNEWSYWYGRIWSLDWGYGSTKGNPLDDNDHVSKDGPKKASYKEASSLDFGNALTR